MSAACRVHMIAEWRDFKLYKELKLDGEDHTSEAKLAFSPVPCPALSDPATEELPVLHPSRVHKIPKWREIKLCKELKLDGDQHTSEATLVVSSAPALPCPNRQPRITCVAFITTLRCNLLTCITPPVTGYARFGGGD